MEQLRIDANIPKVHSDQLLVNLDLQDTTNPLSSLDSMGAIFGV